MRITERLKLLCLIAALFCLTAAVAKGQDDEERMKLLDQQRQLDQKIEVLKREQDFLLFQKTLYASDSKYLIIRLSDKTGQLKYKNRVLRDFHFSITGGNKRRGAVSLTKKAEGAKGPKFLVFGKSLILRTKRYPAPAVEGSCLVLGKKDFNAIFYALEDGARAYLLL